MKKIFKPIFKDGKWYVFNTETNVIITNYSFSSFNKWGCKRFCKFLNIEVRKFF